MCIKQSRGCNGPPLTVFTVHPTEPFWAPAVAADALTAIEAREVTYKQVGGQESPTVQPLPTTVHPYHNKQSWKHAVVACVVVYTHRLQHRS